jgi:acetyltransferase-like isoleucine patch superfamily enzyme
MGAAWVGSGTDSGHTGLIYPNVDVGEGTIIQDGAIVGEPPRGVAPGQLKTTIGASGMVRSGTVIYAGAVIGDRFNSGHGALIRENNVIGDDCSVGTNAVLEVGNRVGSGTRIHSGCFLEHTTLGERVFLAPHVVFTDDPHPMCPRYLECVLGATVADDVSIGANVTILPGLKIGAGSLVGAGSVVTKDVEAGSVVAGSPAVRIKNVAELVCFKGYFERPYIWRTERTRAHKSSPR